MALLKKHDVYVGIDVDKKSYAFTVYNNDVKKSKKIPSNAEQLHSYLQKNYPNKNILYAYEAGPTGYDLYDYLKSKKSDCMVVSPNSIPKPSNERVKNNRLDSQSIAFHLKAGNLTSIRIPEGPWRELRHLVRIRERYACQRKITRQRIKGLLLFAHLFDHIQEDTTKWSNRYIKSLENIPCTDAVRIRLNSLLSDLSYAREKLLKIHKQIKEFVNKHHNIQKNVEYCTSIPGIGIVTATNIFGKIGNPAHLKNVRELGSFVGLTPRERSTGDTVKRGQITRFGDKNLRKLLIEAAWVAIRCDSELNMFYYRILNRNHPKGAAQKAIVAVARKLTMRIYSVIKNQKKYEKR
jgi:transposase